MKILIGTALLAISSLALAEAGSWKSVSINETTSNVHNHVFTAEEVCQIVFMQKATSLCPSKCIEGLAGWHWRASQAKTLSGSTLAGNATVYCQGVGTYSCKGPQTDVFGRPIDVCLRQ